MTARTIAFLTMCVLIPAAATATPDLGIAWSGFEIPSLPGQQGLAPWPPLTDRPTVLQVVIVNEGSTPVDQPFRTVLFVDGVPMEPVFEWPAPDELLDAPPGVPVQIDPGGTRLYAFEVGFASPGTHTLLWRVDEGDMVPESDEGNNQLSLTATWQAPPDLIVEDIWPAGPVGGGQSSTWKIRVRNQGAGAALVPFLTTLMPQGIAGGAQENFWTTGLAAGAAVEYQTTQSFNAWGTLTMEAETDVGNYLAEALPGGEGNNFRSETFSIQPVDLRVRDLQISPGNPRSCDLITYSFVVENTGAGAASQPFKVRVMPGKVSPTGLLQPEMLTVHGLNPGQSVTLQHTIRLPAADHLIIVEADAFDPYAVYADADRSDNTRTLNLHVDGPFNGLNMCLGESLFVDDTVAGDLARDQDNDWLKDDLENALAEGFRPYFKFDSAELARRSFEPVTLFQVRPDGCVGPGCSGTTELFIMWTFLFKWDGGYGPSSNVCTNAHMGDNQTTLFRLRSSDGGKSWTLYEVLLGGFGWPTYMHRPAYWIGKRAIPGTMTAEWHQGHHLVIYMSGHKHHHYFDTAYDHQASYFSAWSCSEDVNGLGAAFLADLHSVFGGQQFNNVGEPQHHPADVFVNCMSQFPATVIGRTVDTGNAGCNSAYSAWGQSHFYEVSANADNWLSAPDHTFTYAP